LEALGNLGEFVGSIAVLVSLIYLGIQLRKSAETERTSTYQSIVSDFGRMNQSLASDPELLILYVKAMEDFESLTPSEKARISQVFYMTFRYFENMYYQHRKGYLEAEVWGGWKRLMLTYFARPGFESWWQMRRAVYSDSFATFLETEKLDRPVASYADVVGISTSPGAPPA
jgi:hypothetical protein